MNFYKDNDALAKMVNIVVEVGISSNSYLRLTKKVVIANEVKLSHMLKPLLLNDIACLVGQTGFGHSSLEKTFNDFLGEAALLWYRKGQCH